MASFGLSTATPLPLPRRSTYRHPGAGLDPEHGPHRLLCRRHVGLLPQSRYSAENIPYTTTLPDELVSAGKADFGISFESEVAIDETEDLPVTSVMAILQHWPRRRVPSRFGDHPATRAGW